MTLTLRDADGDAFTATVPEALLRPSPSGDAAPLQRSVRAPLAGGITRLRIGGVGRVDVAIRGTQPESLRRGRGTRGGAPADRNDDAGRSRPAASARYAPGASMKNTILAVLARRDVLGASAEAAVQTLPGKRLVARRTQRFVFVTTTAVTAPARGGPDDPTVAGAVLQIINPTTQEYANFPLPGGQLDRERRRARRIATATPGAPCGPSCCAQAGASASARRSPGITLDESIAGEPRPEPGERRAAVLRGLRRQHPPRRAGPLHRPRRAGAGLAARRTLPACAVARVIATQNDVIEGPLSRGRLGDFLLANDEIQVIVQQTGRVIFGIGTYGGNIIDADRAAPDRRASATTSRS